MRAVGRSARQRWATACTKGVLPTPVPPQRNSGLWRRPPPPAAATDAACASWFDGPMTKFANVYFGFKPSMGGGTAARRGAASLSGVVVAVEGGDPSVGTEIGRGRTGDDAGLSECAITGIGRPSSIVHATCTLHPVW